MFSLFVVHWINKRFYKDAREEIEAVGCYQLNK